MRRLYKRSKQRRSNRRPVTLLITPGFIIVLYLGLIFWTLDVLSMIPPAWDDISEFWCDKSLAGIPLIELLAYVHILMGYYLVAEAANHIVLDSRSHAYLAGYYGAILVLFFSGSVVLYELFNLPAINHCEIGLFLKLRHIDGILLQ